MTDLHLTLPTLSNSLKAYTHLLPPLENSHISTLDLLTLDPALIARRAQLPARAARDLSGLIREVRCGIECDLGLGLRTEGEGEKEVEREGKGEEQAEGGRGGAWSAISTLDESLDEVLGGGILTGYITEITGESGTGKTQLLLTLLLSAQLPPPHGLGRPTLYISTEHPLPTSRLTQLLATHPTLRAHPSPPSLSRILTLQTPDLESQDHILTYQLPVALAQHRIGLCIIDSIAANYRAERPDGGMTSHSPSALAYRSTQLVRLGALLRSLARKHDCAIVVANQVSDRFPPPTRPPLYPPLPSTSSTSTPTPTPSASSSSTSKPLPHHTHPHTHPHNHNQASTPPPLILSLDHQQRFFTGWGANPYLPNIQLKTPSLGPVWTNQIACRIALVKQQRGIEHFGGGGAAPLHSRPGDQGAVGDRTEGDVKLDNKDNDNEDENPTTKTTTTFSQAPAPNPNPKTTSTRTLRLVFAPWTSPTADDARGIEFEIWAGGIRSC